MLTCAMYIVNADVGTVAWTTILGNPLQLFTSTAFSTFSFKLPYMWFCGERYVTLLLKYIIYFQICNIQVVRFSEVILPMNLSNWNYSLHDTVVSKIRWLLTRCWMLTANRQILKLLVYKMTSFWKRIKLTQKTQHTLIDTSKWGVSWTLNNAFYIVGR